MRKSYRKHSFLRISAVLASLVFFLGGIFSCEDVDNTFGQEFIPDDQHVKVALDTEFIVRAYNISSPDSLPAGGFTLNMLGSYTDENTGISTNAGVAFQMTTPVFVNKDSLYGINPVIDSAFLKLSIIDRMGNIDKEQMFDMYELTERIWSDSTYYFDFDVDAIRKNEPLFSFSHSGEDTYIEYKIEDQEFLTQLLDTTGYWSDSLFKDRFPGFYVKPRVKNADVAMYQLYLDQSYIQVYYHNQNPKPDTLSVSYDFLLQDSYGYGHVYNHCVNVIDRDYSNLNPDIHLDDPENTSSRVFVQSYGGILTKLEFAEESIKRIKAKVKDEKYSRIAINKAILKMPYPARDPEVLDHMSTRFGMYSDYKKEQGITDFSIDVEQYMRSYQSSSYRLPYGGYLNRSLFHYEMDITGYVQYLFLENTDEEELKVEVTLAPTYRADNLDVMTSFYNIHSAVLEGYEGDEPISLVITYTMLR